MFLAVAMVVALATPAPEPTLKEIGRVRSTAFCTALGKKVGPIVDGLIRNDALINAGERNFVSMGSDLTQNNPSGLALGKMRADSVVVALARNLNIMDRIFGDMPDDSRTEDDREMTTLKANLAQLSASQKSTLNMMEGILETSKLGQMKNEMPTQMDSVVGQNTTPHMKDGPIDSEARTYLDVAGLPDMNGIPQIVNMRDLANSSMLGQTIYGRVAIESYTAKLARIRLEDITAAKISVAVNQCGGRMPPPGQPIPAPSGPPTK